VSCNSLLACITHNTEESGQDLELRFVLAVLAVSTLATWRALALQLVLCIHVESVIVGTASCHCDFTSTYCSLA
jgi:hypothetical protein